MLAKLKSRAVVIGLVCLAVGGARAEPTDNWLQEYVVQFLWGPEWRLGGAGVYLGKGLVITAAHGPWMNAKWSAEDTAQSEQPRSITR